MVTENIYNRDHGESGYPFTREIFNYSEQGQGHPASNINCVTMQYLI